MGKHLFKEIKQYVVPQDSIAHKMKRQRGRTIAMSWIARIYATLMQKKLFPEKKLPLFPGHIITCP